jgi:hypothetical protein
MKLFRFLLILPILASNCLADPLPVDAADLLLRRNHEVAKLDDKFNAALERLKKKHAAANKLKEALAIQKVIDKNSEQKSQHSNDPLIGRKHAFLGSNKDTITYLTFLEAGKTECTKYKSATWQRLSDNAILFNYGTGSSFIVFHKNGDLWEGYHSTAGKTRYLKEKS